MEGKYLQIANSVVIANCCIRSKGEEEKEKRKEIFNDENYCYFSAILLLKTLMEVKFRSH